MGAAIGLLHLLGWGLIGMAEAQSHSQALSLGVALTAYTLGMRHAFDADHIAAIDNTTRKLRQDGRVPLSTGFWFSLGHSTVVFVLALALAFAAGRIYGGIVGGSSWLHSVGGVLGTLVSALFLYAIAALNLQGLRETLRASGGTSPPSSVGGPLFRIFGRVVQRIRRPSGMYPVGLLFGLGFDTATEVALLATTAGAAMAPLPWYGVVALPCLFAAGMSICDTLDGIAMQYAYDWSLLQPGRRRLWNVWVTGVSVMVAFGVGTIELLGLAGGWLHRTARIAAGPPSLDPTRLGVAVVLLLLVSWLSALLLWRERGPKGRSRPRAAATLRNNAEQRNP